jgi:hypothetical protein
MCDYFLDHLKSSLHFFDWTEENIYVFGNIDIDGFRIFVRVTRATYPEEMCGIHAEVRISDTDETLICSYGLNCEKEEVADEILWWMNTVYRAFSALSIHVARINKHVDKL